MVQPAGITRRVSVGPSDAQGNGVSRGPDRRQQPIERPERDRPDRGHDQRRSGAEFNDKIPVGNRIQRIFANAVEPQLSCYRFSIDRIAGPCQRRSAKRQFVHALPAVG